MAFNFVEKRISKVIDKVKTKSVLNEENISELLKEIRIILLEADVNLKVVKKFIEHIKNKSMGEVIDFNKSSSQELIKIISDELIEILGGESTPWKATFGDIIMMVGLQGSGKTTSTVKLANYLSKRKKFYKKPLLVGLDVYRPAAIDQLEKLCKTNGFQFYSERKTRDVKRILREAIGYAKFNENDLVILDTAGRLQTDDELMDELLMIKKEVNPKETIFVADSMSGQELINIAEEFNNKISLSSALITKLDSDAKGGAALSLSSLLNLKIKFIGVGEKITDLEIFHPDRMASRILGLGDIETLIEKVEDSGISESKNEKMMRKIISGKFDLLDLLESMEAMKGMGSLSTISKLMPGKSISKQKSLEADEKIKNFEILMSSMTLKEKKHPNLLKHPKRRERIISGSGKNLRDYNILIRDFEKSKKQMKEMGKQIKAKNSF